jgi:hypothetical protein
MHWLIRYASRLYELLFSIYWAGLLVSKEALKEGSEFLGALQSLLLSLDRLLNSVLHGAIFADLVAILSSANKVPGTNSTVGDLAQTQVFTRLGRDANGNTLTTASFIRYLAKRQPGFFDATTSTFCHDALTSTTAEWFCALPLYEGVFGTVQSYFETNPQTGAQTQTPSDPLLTFIKPSFILLSSSGKNMGNEATIVHEALPGLTGLYDLQIMGFGVTSGQYICNITTYIQNDVLSYSRLAGTATNSCP